MTSSRWLFWHRRDLRLADNLGLAAAAAPPPAVTGVFVLDPAILDRGRHGPGEDLVSQREPAGAGAAVAGGRQPAAAAAG
jgi:hypothetical protein